MLYRVNGKGAGKGGGTSELTELDEYAITVRVHTYNIIINHMGPFVQPKIVRAIPFERRISDLSVRTLLLA